MLNKRGNLKEAKENVEKSISLIDKTIGNMPISNRYSLFQKEGNFQYEVYSNNIKVLLAKVELQRNPQSFIYAKKSEIIHFCR